MPNIISFRDRASIACKPLEYDTRLSLLRAYDKIKSRIDGYDSCVYWEWYYCDYVPTVDPDVIMTTKT